MEVGLRRANPGATLLYLRRASLERWGGINWSGGSCVFFFLLFFLSFLFFGNWRAGNGGEGVYVRGCDCPDLRVVNGIVVILRIWSS